MDIFSETRPVVVIDDDPDVAVLLQHLLREGQLGNPLRAANDVDQGLRLLEGMATAPPPEFPLLILVDLRMPRASGFEVLTWLMRHPRFARVPRVVLSSSLDERDVARAQTVGASGFLNKFPAPATLAAIVRFSGTVPHAPEELAGHFPELLTTHVP